MLDKVHAYISAHHDRILADLVDFASIPSVSTDPAYKAAVGQAVDWVAAQLRQAGLTDVRVVPTAGHPVVYAAWTGAPGAPTVLVYGHYDVQPPDPLDKWASDPFRPVVRDGRIYARGVSDDKGPTLIAIKAVEAFLATTGALPVNVKFLLEGEEECGSPNLEPFIRDHAPLLAADFVLSADGAMWRIDEPSITVASRGLAGLEFTLTGPRKDLHSGRHGGSVANPLHAIAQLVAGLHDADGRVAVEGFYDDVLDLTPEERRAIAALPFDERRYLDEVGAPSSVGEAGYSLLERQWARPTLEVNGMWGGYQGEGSKTIIPSEAHAKIGCRLVPAQDPHDITRKIVRHLERHQPPGTRVTITLGDHSAFPYRIAPSHIGLTVAEQVLRNVYGKPPLLVRMGATLPVADLFRRYLRLDTVFFSFSTADEDFHAPNEFFRLHRLQEGLEAWTGYLDLLAAKGAALAAPHGPAAR